MATDQTTTATSRELNRPLRSTAQAQADTMATALYRIAGTLSEQDLAIEHLKELVQFISGQETYQDEPNPWLAVYRFLDTIGDEIGSAVHNLEQLVRDGKGGAA